MDERENEVVSEQTEELSRGEILANLSQKIKEAKIPVIILFEGWGGSGKGKLIGKLIEDMDPRGFKVYTTGEASSEDLRYPMMKRFWKNIPEYGKFSIYDRSWYREVTISRVEQELSKKEVDYRFREIIDFENQLSDDGYVILKFFLRISKKEQRKRFEKLEADPATSWRVTRADWKHNKQYDDYKHAFEEMIERTDRDYAPWFQIDAQNSSHAVEVVFDTVIAELQKALLCPKKEAPERIRTDETIVPIHAPRLCDIDLSKTADPETYKLRLKSAQKRLFELHNILYRRRIPVIIAYEGWDAAGKGGNIKRLTSGLDPRGYEVVPVASPSPVELHHQYLWRFWNNIPKDGHIAIFDRTWYGRVMVERIEGFCTEEQWKRAYDEMNHFERSLTEWGAIVIKFWLHIDKDEQLRRFEERQNTPSKQWKITDEDWRNREKWDIYEQTVDDMLHYTNTDYAPWIVVESNDKKYARLKTINAVIDRIEKALD